MKSQLKRLQQSLPTVPISTRLSWFAYGAFTFLALSATAFAAGDSPWASTASSISSTLTGPMATTVSTIAVVLGGLGVAFGEGQANKTLGGIALGVGMLLGAANFVTWISPSN